MLNIICFLLSIGMLNATQELILIVADNVPSRIKCRIVTGPTQKGLVSKPKKFGNQGKKYIQVMSTGSSKSKYEIVLTDEKKAEATYELRKKHSAVKKDVVKKYFVSDALHHNVKQVKLRYYRS